MNRRAFLTGLLAGTATIPLVKAAPFAPYGDIARQVNAMRDLDWRYAIAAANVPYGVIGPFPRNGKTFWAVGRTLWWMENDE